MIYTHVLNREWGAVRGPADCLLSKEAVTERSRGRRLGLLDCERPQLNAAARKPIWPANPFTIEAIRLILRCRVEEIGCRTA